MKFLALLKKELKEMLSVGTIVGMLIGVVLLFIIGQVMSGVTADSAKSAGTVHLVDEDQSALSQSCISMLRESGFEVIEETAGALGGEANYKPQGDYNLLVFPKGFEAAIESGSTAELKSYGVFDKLGITAMFSSGGSSAAFEAINEAVSNQLIAQNLGGAAGSPNFYKNPVTLSETTFVGDNHTDISPSLLSSFATSQTAFVPIVIFILVMFASQMIASAIANEKGDKTLETLLCTPVSRLTVLSSKMCAAGIVSLLMAAVYMVGFSGYMNGITGGNFDAASTNELGQALSELGVSLSVTDYLLIGIQLFLTILSALAVSLVLGALAGDIKQAQSTIMPLMFALLLPYMVTLFMDVSQLAIPLRILMYLIPFTHTFIAPGNLIFDNYPLLFGGMIYQVVFLAVAMTLAVKVFSSDKIFTMKLNFGQKKRKTPVEP